MASEGVGYAVLFSVPAGVGVSMGVFGMMGGAASNSFVIGSGVVTALAVFSLVALILITGSPEEV